ncbi:MAG TPA: VWA domain-containing protein, partial [Gemmataceae bacterium]|nr:VWA domain-containing protein [Gemmataceae bacterium]
GKIEARGGTEMAEPLKQAVQQLAGGEAGRSRILVLVTDGQVGHEDQILGHLSSQLQDVRIFTLGIDQAVNAGFLRRLAVLGGGACELVESEDRLDEVMERIHRRIGRPVLTGLRVQPAGLEIDGRSLVPTRLTDLYAGAPLFILGRCLPAAKGTMQIEATDAVGRSWSRTVALGEEGSPMLSAVWARGRVRDLEDRYLVGGDRATLEKQIVETSLRFGVLSRFTAYLAVDVQEVVNRDGKVHRVTQPIEPAAGWAMLGTEKLPGDGTDRCWRSVSQAAAAPLRSIRAKLQSRERVERRFEGLPGLAEENELSPASPPLALDLTAYRRRAAELLRDMQLAATRGDDRIRLLHVLVVQLQALLHDLATTGQAAGEVQPLGEWLNDCLAWILAGAVQTDVAPLWQRAEAVLTAFSQGTGQTTGRRRRRKGWWK